MTNIDNTNQRSSSIFKTAIWISIVALLALIAWGLLNNSGERPQIGDDAPDVPLTFFANYEWDGQSAANLSDMQGQIVVLNFWASWCVECTYEADDLEMTWRAYQDKGVVFLGVAYTDIDTKSIEFLQEYDITYPNAPDIGGEIYETYHAAGVPETVIIDQNGQVAASTIGPIHANELAVVLDQLLAE